VAYIYNISGGTTQQIPLPNTTCLINNNPSYDPQFYFEPNGVLWWTDYCGAGPGTPGNQRVKYFDTNNFTADVQEVPTLNDGIGHIIRAADDNLVIVVPVDTERVYSTPYAYDLSNPGRGLYEIPIDVPNSSGSSIINRNLIISSFLDSSRSFYSCAIP
jgi:hypothetical protein